MMRPQAATAGFSLVELMVGMTLGVLLIGGVITVFSGSKSSAEINTTMGELQESARFALDTMTRDTRMAGFQGCIDVNSASATLRADAVPSTDYSASALSAATIEADGSWNPAAPLNFTIPVGRGAPIPGTHALSVQFGNPETFTMQPMTQVSSQVVLDDADSGITTGDLVLISNCQVADIFEVTAAAGASLAHAGDKNGGDDRLSAPYGQAGAQNRARVMRFESNIYYIGDTGRTNGNGDPVHSLFRQSLPYSNPPIEMVEGSANMKIRLGFRDAATGNLTFVTPDAAVTAVGRVETVQLGLLMQSVDPVSDTTDTRSYHLAGQRLTPSTEGTTATTTLPGGTTITMFANTYG